MIHPHLVPEGYELDAVSSSEQGDDGDSTRLNVRLTSSLSCEGAGRGAVKPSTTVTATSSGSRAC